MTLVLRPITDLPDYNNPSSSFPRDQYIVFDPEAMFYYLGLPSNPRLVYHVGTMPWVKPTGLEAYRVFKELHPVFGYKLNSVWKDVGPKVCDILDSVGVLWTTIDVVGFIRIKEGESIGPVVIWIGVTPETVCGKDVHTAAQGCLDLLREFDITDIEIEFGSLSTVYTRSSGFHAQKQRYRLTQRPTHAILSPLFLLSFLSVTIFWITSTSPFSMEIPLP
ncbi:hypothetical protein CPB84DRAFT_1845038 [Gymnopilus junonius]|uniref:Uncharacterized protein n=1 Tax=Gymnopilus junonius TaxID=109634 RepID=A0A9P5NU11_GYMJU|nr:hypothetical protein CPB84DRAFT_1845038 [Gymnopilus junonius]